ncbi:MAG: 4'-phosphopantetheinyl transferase superfamily protein [Bacteroidaceae bacterium]|nr:4'-phosphopantetheinyl transferase superfamily protein [Bacteroidaceae bacterium]
MRTERLQIAPATIWIATLTPPGEPARRTPISEQRAAVAELLRLAGFPPQALAHTEQGKPYIYISGVESPHISISHTHTHAALAVAPCPIGLDIERISPRPLRVLGRITDAHERALLPHPASEAEATRLWCCKEAVFKLHSPALQAVTEIRLSDFTSAEARTAPPFVASAKFLERDSSVICLASATDNTV